MSLGGAAVAARLVRGGSSFSLVIFPSFFLFHVSRGSGR